MNFMGFVEIVATFSTMYFNNKGIMVGGRANGQYDTCNYNVFQGNNTSLFPSGGGNISTSPTTTLTFFDG